MTNFTEELEDHEESDSYLNVDIDEFDGDETILSTLHHPKTSTTNSKKKTK